MTRIALVVLDTLRKDAFDEYFDWIPGRRFERAFATANWTSPAHASLLAGQYPSEAGVHAKSPSFDIEDTVLPEQFADAGYKTRCWSANPNISPSRQWDRGFNEFVGASALNSDVTDSVDWSSFTYDESSWLGRATKYPRAVLECLSPEYDTLESLWRGFLYAQGGLDSIKDVPDDGASSVRNRLQETKFQENEFLYINLMEAHTPYYTPPGHSGPDWEDAITVTIKDSIGLETPREGTEAAYFQACRYLASVYQDIFDELMTSFDYVVTLADHGEMLGESGTWNHTYGLFPEITHVPLVISGNGLSGQSDAVVSHLDVHRTLLDLADISGSSRGQNLLEVETGQPILTEYHGLIPVARQRLEEEQVPTEVLETYDNRLFGVAIPPDYYRCETTDGFLEQGKTDEDPDTILERLQDSISERAVGEVNTELSDDVLDQLDDLGYV